MKLMTLIILAFLLTLLNVNATEFSFNTTQSNDSLLSIVNITKMYNFNVFTELNLVLSAHKNALESGNFVEYNKVAARWNHIMRIAGNKTIIELWNMPIRPEPKKRSQITTLVKTIYMMYFLYPLPSHFLYSLGYLNIIWRGDQNKLKEGRWRQSHLES